ncbi:hypothetical protein [Anaerosinus sp.]|uniref:hypothetical protein n=1 Tax=Selenobaculum sp. TaxID=3074374 RepID=UPI003AB81AC9
MNIVDLAKEGEMMSTENKKPDEVYSFHTFILPFTYKRGDQGEEKDRNEFEKLLEQNKAWQKVKWSKEELPEYDLCKWHDDQDSSSAYATFQYFNAAGRAAILGTDKGHAIVSKYLFKPNKQKKQIMYKINIPTATDTSSDKEKEVERSYLLNVYAIRLQVYDNNVAILIIESTYDGNGGTGEKVIKEINQYGRRIRMPFIPPALVDGETAKSLELYIGDDKPLKDDFSEQLSKNCQGETPQLLFIPEFILRLFDYGGSDKWAIYSKSESLSPSATCKFIIQPISDDRMFVACTVCDKNLLPCYKAKNRQDEYSYQSDYDLAKRLYSILFVDKDSATCQNQQMIQKILEKSVYGRWLDCGTLHAVTHHSMFCLTDKYNDVKYTVVRPFLTEYVEMLTLVLAQRATVIVLQDAASRLSNKGKDKLIDLQKKYVALQNQLLLFEVTPQEQGIEMYQLLRQQLYLTEEQDVLEKQLHNLYEMVTIQHAAKLNKWGIVINIVIFILGICWGKWSAYLMGKMDAIFCF